MNCPMLVSRWLPVAVLTIGLFLLVLGRVYSERSQPNNADVERLVKQLGSEKFSEREAAAKALEAIGEPALEVLGKVINGKDAEVARRAKAITTAILKENSGKREMRRVEGPQGEVWRMAFSADRRRVLSYSGKTGLLLLWDMESGEELLRLEGHRGSVGGLAFSPDGCRAVSTGFDENDTFIRLWDVTTGKELRRFDGHRYPVYGAAFSPDGTYVLSYSSDKTLQLWDAETGKQVRRFDGHTAGVRAAIFSPDGRRILSCDLGKTMRLWDVETGKDLGSFVAQRAFAGHKAPLYCVALSSDGRRAVSGGGMHISRGPDDRDGATFDCTVRLWDLEKCEVLREFDGHQDYVTQVVFAPDNRRILSADRRRDVRLWDVETGRELRRFDIKDAYAIKVAFSNDGQQVLIGTSRNTVHVWSVPK